MFLVVSVYPLHLLPALRGFFDLSQYVEDRIHSYVIFGEQPFPCKNMISLNASLSESGFFQNNNLNSLGQLSMRLSSKTA